MGNVLQAGEGQAPTRQALLEAGMVAVINGILNILASYVLMVHMYADVQKPAANLEKMTQERIASKSECQYLMFSLYF